jgi:hypothetical protein
MFFTPRIVNIKDIERVGLGAWRPFENLCCPASWLYYNRLQQNTPADTDGVQGPDSEPIIPTPVEWDYGT